MKLTLIALGLLFSTLAHASDTFCVAESSIDGADQNYTYMIGAGPQGAVPQKITIMNEDVRRILHQAVADVGQDRIDHWNSKDDPKWSAPTDSNQVCMTGDMGKSSFNVTKVVIQKINQ